MRIHGDPSFVNHHSAFRWDRKARTFTGEMSNLTGFTGEHYDGEAIGLAIEGISGETLWFHVAEIEKAANGSASRYLLKPTCSRGAELIDFGLITEA